MLLVIFLYLQLKVLSSKFS